jgi:hypothetical protein
MTINGSAKTQTLALAARIKEFAIGSARQLRRPIHSRAPIERTSEDRFSPHIRRGGTRAQQEKEAIGAGLE